MFPALTGASPLRPDIVRGGFDILCVRELTGAMMLRYSLNLADAAGAVETAVAQVLDAGIRTPDIVAGGRLLSTSGMGDAVVRYLRDGQ